MNIDTSLTNKLIHAHFYIIPFVIQPQFTPSDKYFSLRLFTLANDRFSRIILDSACHL